MTILLASFASSGSLVDLDATYLIQLGIFLVVFLLLRSLLFRPVIRLIEARHDATVVAQQDATKFETEALELEEEVASKLTKIRAEASTEREHLVEAARRRERELLAKTRDDAAGEALGALPGSCQGDVRFLLTVEISSIYKRHDRVRKVHNLVLAPGFEQADELVAKLETLTNLRVVPHPEDTEGHLVRAGPFPGWRTVPEW